MTEATLNHRDDAATVTAPQAGTASALRSLVGEVTTFGADVLAFFGAPKRL